jgi:hypothetical protein
MWPEWQQRGPRQDRKFPGKGIEFGPRKRRRVRRLSCAPHDSAVSGPGWARHQTMFLESSATVKTQTHDKINAPGTILRLSGGLGLIALAALPAPTVSASPLLAELSINITVDAPPPPLRHEVIVERDRPGPDYVWVGGFWDGTPGHYVWVAGHWDRPPRAHAQWIAPHWDKDHDGHYRQVRGEWR